MILLTSIVFFFFIFFLGLSISNIVKFQETELRSKIEDRLKNADKMITEVRITKRERLSDLPFLDHLLRKLIVIRKLQNYIGQSGLSLSVGSFVLLSLVFASLIFLPAVFFNAPFQFASVSALGFLFLPFLFVSLTRSRRIKKFSTQFPDCIGLITSSLRAGHSFQMAIETVVEEGKDLVSSEFRQVLSEVEVGQNFEEALKGILTRVDTPDLRLFISGVILQRETGGNLAELLDNLEVVIRERQELKRELSAATAQAKLSGLILSLLPIFVGLFVFVVNRNYMLFFFNDPIGTKILLGCVVGQMFGIFWISKVVKIEF